MASFQSFKFKVTTCISRSDTYTQKITDIKIPSWAVGPTALKVLCQDGVTGLDKVEPASSGGSAAKRDLESAKPPESSEVRVIKRSMKVEEPREKKQKLHEDHDNTGTQGDQEKERNQIADDGAQDDLVGAAMDKIKDRPKGQAERDHEAAAKVLLKRKGFEFNTHFQAAHKGLPRMPSHWKDFLAGVMGVGDIQCSACQNLIKQFQIDAFEPLVVAEPVVPEPVLAPDGLQIVPVENEYTPPKKRSRAGRPKKGDGVEFDFRKYMEESRAGQYRWLDESKAMERLQRHFPAKTRATDAVRLEMAKNPVQCLICGIFLHLPHNTNNLALPLCLSL